MIVGSTTTGGIAVNGGLAQGNAAAVFGVSATRNPEDRDTIAPRAITAIGNTNSAEGPATAQTQTTRRGGADRDLLSGLTEAERQEVRELAARDREVRAHEQAHANVGGRYAGAPTYTYERGPDGRQYAIGGEVSIDVSPVPGDPQATINKAQIVRRAALAPAQPSAQDRAVAAEATAIEQQARAELIAERAEERNEERSTTGDSDRSVSTGQLSPSPEAPATREGAYTPLDEIA